MFYITVACIISAVGVLVFSVGDVVDEHDDASTKADAKDGASTSTSSGGTQGNAVDDSMAGTKDGSGEGRKAGANEQTVRKRVRATE